jgi:hypothetical protein
MLAAQRQKGDANMLSRMSIPLIALAAALAMTANPVAADQTSMRAAIGGGLGAAHGAFIGGELGGPNAAILGSGLAGAAGAAIATLEDEKKPSRYSRRLVHYSCPPGHWKKGRCR